jgi:phosphoenolpyruvate carboxylase
MASNYSDTRQSELAIFAMPPRSCASSFGADAIRHYIISHTETVSDLLEVLLLQKEVGLLRGILNGPRLATGNASTQGLPTRSAI